MPNTKNTILYEKCLACVHWTVVQNNLMIFHKILIEYSGILIKSKCVGVNFYFWNLKIQSKSHKEKFRDMSVRCENDFHTWIKGWIIVYYRMLLLVIYYRETLRPVVPHFFSPFNADGSSTLMTASDVCVGLRSVWNWCWSRTFYVQLCFVLNCDLRLVLDDQLFGGFCRHLFNKGRLEIVLHPDSIRIGLWHLPIRHGADVILIRELLLNKSSKCYEEFASAWLVISKLCNCLLFLEQKIINFSKHWISLVLVCVKFTKTFSQFFVCLFVIRKYWCI